MKGHPPFCVSWCIKIEAIPQLIDITCSSQSELGSWTESSAGWDDELNEDLSEEATSILKEKRRIEREIRTNEQKRKKEALRAQRAEKKHAPFLGMKMN